MPYHLLLSSILLYILSLISAQQVTLIPASLPACAQSCPLLIQAQGACVPPAALVTNPATYQSCFCQSAFLGPLRSSPTSNICAPQCPDADFATIGTWYKGLCGIGGAAPPATTLITTSTGSPTSTSATSSATTDSAGVQVQSSSSGSDWYLTRSNLLHCSICANHV